MGDVQTPSPSQGPDVLRCKGNDAAEVQPVGHIWGWNALRLKATRGLGLMQGVLLAVYVRYVPRVMVCSGLMWSLEMVQWRCGLERSPVAKKAGAPACLPTCRTYSIKIWNMSLRTSKVTSPTTRPGYKSGCEISSNQQRQGRQSKPGNSRRRIQALRRTISPVPPPSWATLTCALAAALSAG